MEQAEVLERNKSTLTVVREDPNETLNLTSVFSNMPLDDFDSTNRDRVGEVLS